MQNAPMPADGGFINWVGDQLINGLDWLFLGYSFNNAFVAYGAILGFAVYIILLNRIDQLEQTEADLTRKRDILSRIDPDIVDA